jgi:hypothetical protein
MNPGNLTLKSFYLATNYTAFYVAKHGREKRPMEVQIPALLAGNLSELLLFHL